MIPCGGDPASQQPQAGLAVCGSSRGNGPVDDRQLPDCFVQFDVARPALEGRRDAAFSQVEATGSFWSIIAVIRSATFRP